MAGPQTTREALIAELLGDVGALLDRVEALKNAMPAVADAAATQVYLAGEDAAKNIKASADALALSMAKQRDLITKPVSDAAASISQSADAVEGGARRLATLAMYAGLGGGVLGGLITGIALMAFLVR